MWVDGSIDQMMMASSKGILLYVYDVSSGITDIVQTWKFKELLEDNYFNH